MITRETMLTRKSVRTYDGNPLRAEDLEKLQAFAATIENPFGIPVSFVFLDAKEQGLSSPVLTGEPMYVAGKVAKVPYGDVAFGFAMEQLLAAGALDVWHTPIQMKKNRPAVLLSCLCRPADADRLAAEILRCTSTFGVRRTDCPR